MFARVLSGTTFGLDGMKIYVEVDIATRGLPSFQIVGLPSKAIDEARVRVSSAIKNSGFPMPHTRIVVNLAPAHIKKDGSLFDLAIAVCILSAQGIIQNSLLENSLFVGELSLDGSVTEVAGMVSIATCAQKHGIRDVFVPLTNTTEAALIKNIRIYQVKNLLQLVNFFKGAGEVPYVEGSGPRTLKQQENFTTDFSIVKGQEQAKRALEIAAAGGHNVHLYGPPGTGKTMLARSLPSILPPLDQEEMIEIAKIYSISHAVRIKDMTLERPFRAPHHTISRIGLTGGGSNILPGEISLAHRGILFLDELAEYPRYMIESLRQPLEDGVVSITRATGVAHFPCRFTLIAASNPCPCGFLGHPTKQCVCSSSDILRYQKKLSGPIIDRIDIHVFVPPLDQTEISAKKTSESSNYVRKRVQNARLIQKDRFQHIGIKINSEMTPQHIRELCHVDRDAINLLKNAFGRLSLSPRSYFKIIKIAQTIADLEEQGLCKQQSLSSKQNSIKFNHIAEALQYRYKDG